MDIDSSLISAITGSDVERAEIALRNGANCEARNNDGTRALVLAAERGLQSVVRMLLEHGSAASMSGERHVSAVSMAVNSNSSAIVLLLLQSGLSKIDRQVAFQKYIRSNDIEMVRQLYVPSEDDIFELDNGISFLGESASLGHKEICRFLLQGGASVNSAKGRETSPLHMAAAANNQQVCKILVSRGASLAKRNQGGLTPLAVACYNSNTSIALYLGKRMRPDELDMVDDNGNSAIHVAITKAASPEIVSTLISKGANIDQKAQHGPYQVSALFLSIFAGLEDIAILLLDQNCDVDETTIDGKTVWTLAHEKGQSVVLDKLRERNPTGVHDAIADYNRTIERRYATLKELGLVHVILHARQYFRQMLDDSNFTNINQQDSQGFSALHIASAKGYTLETEMLLHHGADPNLQTLLGHTSLHLAASGGQDEIVEMLLCHGANVEATSFDERTPLHTASSSLQLKCTTTLQNHMQTGMLLREDSYLMKPLSYLRSHPAFRDAPEQEPQQHVDFKHRTRPNLKFLKHVFTLLAVHCMPIATTKAKQIESTLFLAILCELVRSDYEELGVALISRWAEGYHTIHGELPKITCLFCRINFHLDLLVVCRSCFWVHICTECKQSNEPDLMCGQKHQQLTAVRSKARTAASGARSLDGIINIMGCEEGSLELSKLKEVLNLSEPTNMAQVLVGTSPVTLEVSIRSRAGLGAKVEDSPTDTPAISVDLPRNGNGSTMMQPSEPLIIANEEEQLRLEIQRLQHEISQQNLTPWKRALAQNNLAYALKERGELNSNWSDLEEARHLAMTAMNTFMLHPHILPLVQVHCYTNLANIYHVLHEYDGNIDNLNKALHCGRQALDSPMDCAETECLTKSNMSRMLLTMFYLSGGRFMWCMMALTLAKQAILLPSNTFGGFKLGLDCFGSALSAVATISHILEPRKVHDQCVRFRRIELAFAQSIAQQLACMQDLSTALHERYELTRNVDDLQDSITVAIRALRKCKGRDARKAALLSNTSTHYIDMYDVDKRDDYLWTALDFAEAGVRLRPLSRSAQRALRIVLIRLLARKDHDTAITMFGGADRYVTLSIKTMEDEKESAYHRLQGGRSAAFILLKQGLWQRALQVYTDLLKLFPKVFEGSINVQEFFSVYEGTKNWSGNMASAALLARQDTDMALDFLETNRALLNRVLFSSITDSRYDLQGLLSWENTIVRMHGTNDSNTIAGNCTEVLKENEALVCLVISDFTSQAIIITLEGSKPLSLPKFPMSRLLDCLSHFQGEARCTTGSHETRFEHNKILRQTLQHMWLYVVEPILTLLDFKKKVGGTIDLPRVWWISSGLAGLLPWHAAGTFGQKSEEGTLDYVVSSYTSTLYHWLSIRSGGPQSIEVKNIQAAVIAMKETIGRSPLGCEDEILAVKTCFQNATLSYNTNNEEALQIIATHHIVHCICHGLLNVRDPSRGGLILREGVKAPLKISDIFSISRKVGFLVYLSACSTAEIPCKDISDIAVSTANAFFATGFRHVIGTLWEVEDRAASSIARDFYQNMESYAVDGAVSDVSVSLALHDAIKVQRISSHDHVLGWAAHMHLGY